MKYSVFADTRTPQNHVNKQTGNIQQNVIAFYGKCQVVQKTDKFWGGEKGRTYRSKVFENPTWGQLFNCAKVAQRYTNDYHHDFFEGFGVESRARNGVARLRLFFGS